MEDIEKIKALIKKVETENYEELTIDEFIDIIKLIVDKKLLLFIVNKNIKEPSGSFICVPKVSADTALNEA